jgi:hypothetical protein
MQFHRTRTTTTTSPSPRPRGRGRRVLLSAMIGAALLLPTAAMARPAHAAEQPPGNAYGIAKNQPNGNAYGRPAPAPVPTATAITLVGIDRTELHPGESALITLQIDAPAGINAAYFQAPGAQADGDMSPDEAGHYTGHITALPTTPLGPLAWQAVVVDGNNAQTVLDGPPLTILAPADAAPAIALVSYPTQGAPGQVYEVRAQVTDDHQLAGVFIQVHDGAPVPVTKRDVSGNGDWIADLYVPPATASGGLLPWRIIADDDAGQRSTVEGPALQVL